MYRTIHPAAAQQRGIGSINYRVHRQRGDVGLAYFQSSIHIDSLKFWMRLPETGFDLATDYSHCVAAKVFR